MREVLAAVVGSCVLLSVGAAVQGAVTTNNLWRFGEDDGTKVSGDVVGTQTNQNVGTYPLFTKNAAGGTTVTMAYSSDVPDGAKLPAGAASTLSVAMNGSDRFTYASNTFKPTDNFGIEIWVKPASVTGYQILALVGANGSSGGTGLRLHDKKVQIILGGVGNTEFTVPEIALNTWTHLAAVRDDGAMNLYVNGVLTGSDITAAPLVPQFGALSVGAYDFGGSNFTGNVDNFRLFTFAPGQFSPSDLLVTVPEPSVIGLACLGMLGLVRRRRRVG